MSFRRWPSGWEEKVSAPCKGLPDHPKKKRVFDKGRPMFLDQFSTTLLNTFAWNQLFAWIVGKRGSEIGFFSRETLSIEEIEGVLRGI
jgi:hypothetical protein